MTLKVQRSTSLGLVKRCSTLGKALGGAALFSLFFLSGKSNIRSGQIQQTTSLINSPHVQRKNEQVKETSKIEAKYFDNGATIALIIPPGYETNIVKAQNKTSNVESVSSMVTRTASEVGINGSFFDLATKSPIGVEIIDGEIVSWNAGKYWYWPIFYVDKNNNPKVYHPQEPLHLYLLINNKKIPIHEVNAHRNINETVMYNKYFFRTSTYDNPGGIDVVIQNGKITKITNGNTEIPKDGFVISFGKNTVDSFNKIYNKDKNQEVSLTTNLPDDIWDGLTLGSTLLENSIVDTNKEHPSSYIRKRHARTGIGIDRDKNYTIVIFSRRPRTLEEFAQLFKKLGAEDAYNADGGGSTSITFQKSNGKYYISNGRPVINGIVFNSRNNTTNKS